MTSPLHSSQSDFHLLDYWRLVVRRRWIVVAALVAVLTGVGVKTFRATPLYRAVATIQIERSDPNVMKFQEVSTFDPSFLSYQDFYQTQYKLLESEAVAKRAVRQLKLSSDPTFLQSDPPGPLARLWSSLTSPLGGKPKTDPGTLDPLLPYTQAVQAGLRVEPVKNSHLVGIAFVSPSPVIAARVSNGLAEAYISFGMDTRIDTSENGADFLTKQIASLRKEVADLERTAQEYGRTKEIIPTSNQETTTLNALEDLQRAFTVAQADRADKEGAYTAVRSARDGSLAQVLASPLIESLTSEVASLEREQAEMSRKFKPGWPALAQISSKLDQARSRLRDETAALATNARAAAESAYRGAVERERNLGTLLDGQKRTAMQLSSDSVEYTNLRSEIAKKRETLEELQKRESEVSLSTNLKDVRQSNIRIIDAARAPEFPYRPNKKLNLFLGLVAGLGIGIGLAFGIEYLDNSIKSAEDIRRLTGYAAIGVIPMHRPTGPRSVRREIAAAGSESPADLITHHDPRSQLAEAYKELRTATLLASPDQPPRTILVTSCLPQEGKSQTSMNLAIALAQAGKRILLVDADLRRPRLHRSFAVDNDLGISTYLSGNAPLERVIRSTIVPGLHLMTSGPIPPNPSELLGSRNFLLLARESAESGGYDHLIFDSPPLLSVADPIVIAAVVDGTIIVVQSGKTPREALIRGASKLRHAAVKVLGAVLNNVTDGDRSYYYRSGYRYQQDEDRAQHADITA